MLGIVWHCWILGRICSSRAGFRSDRRGRQWLRDIVVGPSKFFGPFQFSPASLGVNLYVEITSLVWFLFHLEDYAVFSHQLANLLLAPTCEQFLLRAYIFKWCEVDFWCNWVIDRFPGLGGVLRWLMLCANYSKAFDNICWRYRWRKSFLCYIECKSEKE